MEQKHVGFFDIGTNSVRLMVVRFQGTEFSVVNLQREMIRLGEGEFPEGRITHEAMDRCVTVCGRLVRLLESYGPNEKVAVATSATRDAENADVLLERLKEEAGLEVSVISGLEEARLIYLGVSRNVHMGEGNYLFMDIGGGSTELVVGDREEHKFLDSLKLGAIRLTDLFVESPSAPMGEDVYSRIKSHVRDSSVRALQRIGGLGPLMGGYGSSGTLLNLADMCAIRRKDGSRRITLETLREILRELRAMDGSSRRGYPGIQPERADIIVAGGAIVETIMEDTGVPYLEATDRGLRDGLLLDYLERTMGSGSSVREMSVLRLGRLCHFDEEHAFRVRDLALGLFDSARAEGLHGLGEQDRQLLGYAAMLHDVGMFISFSNHHLHSHYIISNSDMLGFQREELKVMAAVAMYHRKKAPRKKHLQFKELSPEQQCRVKVLSLFLRLAETLDRSHTGSVRSARFKEHRKGKVEMEIYSGGECQFEVWGLLAHQESFRDVFKRHLAFRVYPC
ncbi:MAG: Ppx/GppA family phosphatase [Thermanaerothrix sp.]|nr:Ppx/GppA family phosphatase [Thermanaerothrix sp.]